MQRAKCIFIGDSSANKVGLFYTNMVMDKEKINFELLKTQEILVNPDWQPGDFFNKITYDSKIEWESVDAIVILFSLGNRQYFDRISARWWPELQRCGGNIPVVLLGVKPHKRVIFNVYERFRQYHMDGPFFFLSKFLYPTDISYSYIHNETEEIFISREEIELLAKKINAVKYFECNAGTGIGFKELMDDLVQIVLQNFQQKQSLKEKEKIKKPVVRSSLFSSLFSSKNTPKLTDQILEKKLEKQTNKQIKERDLLLTILKRDLSEEKKEEHTKEKRNKEESNLVLISLEEKKEIKESKIKEFLQRYSQLKIKPMIIIKREQKFTLYGQSATGEWQSVRTLDEKKLNKLKLDDFSVMPPSSENEKLIIKLSILTAVKDDILRKSEQGLSSRLEKVLDLRLNQISKIEKELKETGAATRLVDLVPISTKGGGDCAFHAILGDWDAVEHQIICADIKEKREKIRSAIVDSDSKESLKKLIMEGIKELIISGRVIGASSEALRKGYREFLSDQKELSAMTWSRFEAILQENVVIVEYIKKNHSLAATSEFRDQFYNALNKNEGELYGRILSIFDLHEAFCEYSQLQNTDFGWESVILELKSIKQEYADFIGTSQIWLLPSELSIIAHVFNISVIYYPSIGALPLTLNPTGSPVVAVQFDGSGHFERLQETQYGFAIMLPSDQIPPEVYEEIKDSKVDENQERRQLLVALQTSQQKLNTVSQQIQVLAEQEKKNYAMASSLPLIAQFTDQQWEKIDLFKKALDLYFSDHLIKHLAIARGLADVKLGLPAKLTIGGVGLVISQFLPIPIVGSAVTEFSKWLYGRYKRKKARESSFEMKSANQVADLIESVVELMACEYQLLIGRLHPLAIETLTEFFVKRMGQIKVSEELFHSGHLAEHLVMHCSIPSGDEKTQIVLHDRGRYRYRRIHSVCYNSAELSFNESKHQYYYHAKPHSQGLPMRYISTYEVNQRKLEEKVRWHDHLPISPLSLQQQKQLRIKLEEVYAKKRQLEAELVEARLEIKHLRQEREAQTMRLFDKSSVQKHPVKEQRPVYEIFG